MLELSESKVYQFDEFRLDGKNHRLFRRAGGELVPLTPKAVELLLALVKNKERILSKDELLRLVWSDSIVEESNLSQTIFVLRKALGENTKKPRFILTVPNRGYQFIAQVIEVVTEDKILDEEFLTDTHSNNAQRPETINPRLKPADYINYIWLAVPLVLLLVFGMYWFYPTAKPATVREIKSIAVLPLRSFSSNPAHEDLRLIITDALITKIGSLKTVSVRPTSSVLRFGKEETDVIQAGKKLQVDAILDGRVQIEGEQMRVTLQLVSVTDDKQIWSEIFDGQTGKILNLQDKISAKISDLFDLDPSEQLKFTKYPTENAEAYEAYLKGRFHWDKRTVADYNLAIGNFNSALEKDSNFALANAGLADTYLLLANNSERKVERDDFFRKARESAERALKIDPNLSEAHASLGWLARNSEWNWTKAEFHLKKAVELKPNSANARRWYSLLLGTLGRFDESVSEARKARDLDPLSVSANTHLGWMLVNSNRTDEAITHLQQTINNGISSFGINRTLASAYFSKQLYNEALAEIEKYKDSPEHNLAAEILRGMIYARLGRRAEARQIAQEVERKHGQNVARHHYLPMLYGELGEKDKAFENLETAFNNKDERLVWIKVEPFFESLRGDARYRELLRRITLG